MLLKTYIIPLLLPVKYCALYLILPFWFGHCSLGVWSVQATTGEKPPPRSTYTFTKIDHHRAVVFGGGTGTKALNDAYVLDMEKWVWR